MRSGIVRQWLEQQRKLVASELRRDEVVAAGIGRARRRNNVDHEEQ
jgi:hypothetical protein